MGGRGTSENITGKIIAFEGIDGSGKTTYCRFLADELIARGHTADMISFPDYTGFFGAEIGKMLSGDGETRADGLDPKSMALWYASDRMYSLKNYNNDVDFLLFNRYVMSNAVYQGSRLAPGEDITNFERWVYRLEYDCFGLRKPDLTFVFDVNVDFSRENVIKKGGRDYVGGDKKLDVYENSRALLERARGAYKKLALEDEDVEFISANDMDEVKKQIIEIINKKWR